MEDNNEKNPYLTHSSTKNVYKLNTSKTKSIAIKTLI